MQSNAGIAPRGGCSKSPEERCEGCRKAHDFLPDRDDTDAPTAVRVVRPLKANDDRSAADGSSL